MTILSVCDPPMCRSTGICSAQVGPKPVDLAANLGWLKAQEVSLCC